MKKTTALCLLIIVLIVNRSLSQDADIPFTGILNTVEDVNVNLQPNENSEELMLSTSCDSLLTTMAGGNGHRGNMFNVTALHELTITKFDVHLDSFKTTNYRVYYQPASYYGTENNPSAWTLVGHRDSVHAKPPHRPTPLTIPINITIPAGLTYSFYITSTFVNKNNNYTNGTTLGAPFQQDANLIVYEGCGIEYPFSGTPLAPRKWNGRIHYCLEPVGIDEENVTTVQTSLAPNPFTNSTTLKITGKTPKNYSLKIVDLPGNTVSEITGISANEVNLEKGKMSAGMYLYKLYNKENVIANGKLIIQ